MNDKDFFKQCEKCEHYAGNFTGYCIKECEKLKLQNAKWEQRERVICFIMQIVFAVSAAVIIIAVSAGRY